MSESLLALEIKDLTLVFRDRKATKVVLSDVNLQVKQGEFVAIVGPSGCGKTTLLRIIAGLADPSKGLIFINGIEVNNIPLQIKL